MLKKTLAKKYYELGRNESELDVKFHMYWRCLNYLADLNKFENEGLRSSIRSLVENNIDAFDRDIDFEDMRLDVFYERPVFEDCRVEEERDVYYYQDFNTNKNYRNNDDYILSIKNFQRISEDSDLISFYMSIFKIYEYILKKTGKYTERDNRLMDGSVYLLECGLNNLMNEE